MKILLLGAGQVLLGLAKKIRSSNPMIEVILTSRESFKIAELAKAGYQLRQVNNLNLEQLKALLEQDGPFDIIIDSIPPVFQNSNEPAEQSLFGVKNIAQCFKLHHPQRFIYLSTTGVYGRNDGSVVDENSLTFPQSERARARLLTEDYYRSNFRDTTCYRIAGISSNRNNPLRLLQAGRYPLIENGQRYSNRIHLDDLVEILYQSLDLQKKLPPILNISDGQPLLMADVVKELSDQQCFSSPKNYTLAEARQRGWHTLLGNQRVSNRLLLETFGPIIRHVGVSWMQKISE